jgi:hypothetical protein
MSMSLLKDIAKEVVEAIKRRIEAYRAERRKAEEPVSNAPMTEQELVQAMDAAAAAEGLNWSQSIVDLQKTLRLPSDFVYRAGLAADMDIPNYKGTDEQNTLLHKLVMDEVRSHGIPIPQPQ